jgi:DNA-binding PucR family transcriptional regulator
MADARGQGDVEVDRWVAELAVRLGDRVSEAVSVISASLREDIPELRDQAQVELFNAAVEGNVVTALYALRHNIPVERVEAPTTALEHARRIAQQGVPLNVLIRMYRLGQRRFTRLVLSELQNIEIASQARMTVVDKITETLFAYVDWMSQQIIEVYEEEREGWLETRNSMRAVRVREVLTGRTPVDIDSAIKTIGYPLRWHHVALLLWYPAASGDASELGRMQRFVRELGIAAQAGAPPLFIAADRSTGWAWLPYQSTPTEVVAAVRNFTMQFEDSPSVAIGSSATGVEGFRRSHVQAEAVRWVVLARKDIKPTVVADSDPGLAAAALVGANVEQARDWVAEVLGGLATNTDNDARLRETLRVFLGCGSSNRLAAGELVVHYNTVKYRVGRSLARRGRSITNDRFDVELALLLCHWYGETVLLPSTP